MTQLDEVLSEIKIIKARLFEEKDCLQSRMVCLEQSLSTCQKAAFERRSGYFKMWLVVLGSFITALMAFFKSQFTKGT